MTAATGNIICSEILLHYSQYLMLYIETTEVIKTSA